MAFVVLVPIAFNVIMLAPQLRPAPSINDSAWHLAFVQSASRALATGDNPFDFWAPELECGFPQFLYYQHLPHLAVVALNRMTLNRVDLVTLFNLVRYLLLVGFPLTVYWSMRTMEFSVIASATGAAFSSFISTNNGMGFDYNSYLWYGYGLYTQLWAMHLLFIATACLQRLLVRGTNFVATVVVWSLLVLSHLFYSYMAALSAVVLFLVSISSGTATQMVWITRVSVGIKRVGAVAVIAAVVTSYFWLPFVLEAGYMRQVPIPYVVSTDRPVHTVSTILALRGSLLDYGRPAVLTLMTGLGIVAAILRRRSMTAHVALALSAFWMVLYFVLPGRKWLIAWLPMGGMMVPLRFIGPVHLSAILLIGLAGEWIWSWFAQLAAPWRAVLPATLIVALMLPALRERAALYRKDAGYIARFAKIDSDQGWRDTIAALKSQPPGRTFLVVEQGRFSGEHVIERLLLFHDIETLQTATGLSLNTFAPIQFDGRNPLHYNLFNVRYVIAPIGFQVPWFLTPIKSTNDYTLYRADTTGYATFARIKDVLVPAHTDAQAQTFILRNQALWLYSSDAESGTYWRWDYPNGGASQERADTGTPDTGTILDEHETGSRIVVHADCKTTSNLIFKVTYHPNWHVTIDGRERPIFMVSPSYIGVVVPAGRHEIAAEYRSSMLKKLLITIGACTLTLMILLRRRSCGARFCLGCRDKPEGRPSGRQYHNSTETRFPGTTRSTEPQPGIPRTFRLCSIRRSGVLNQIYLVFMR